MNKLILTLGFVMVATTSIAQNLWQLKNPNTKATGEVKIVPNKFTVWELNDNLFTNISKAAPVERVGETGHDYPIMQLPNPNGGVDEYAICLHGIMHPELSAKYPEIKTFMAQNVNNPGVTARLDYTPFGFHAMVLDGNQTYFIDPLTDQNTGLYQVYFKDDFSKPLQDRMLCETLGENTIEPTSNGNKTNGTTLRKYRLALACTGEYAVAVAGATPTKAAVLAKMVTSINRVSGVYEKELAVTLELIPNQDTLIFLTTSDPYTNNNGSTMLGQNQTTINARIGAANYDIGHVFSTGGGGIAQLGCVCGSSKARGVTGSPNPQGDPFDIDYVSHEMGHQFGGEHTFESETGSCNGNRATSSAYETGSGTTIMAYAGICSTNDIQNNSNAYFSIRSLDQISTFIAGSGNTCPVKTTLSNTPPTFASISTINRTIPFKTYFEVERKATDAENDPLTYCWEQYNLTNSNNGSDWNAVRNNGPIFRSFTPTVDSLRTFPAKNLISLKSYGAKGELLPGTLNEIASPQTSRIMNFKLAVRDVRAGYGSFNYSNENLTITALRLADSFRVTSQSTIGQTLQGDKSVEVTWNVATTNTNTAINAPNVDIFFSDNAGITWPYKIASNVPNDGSQNVFIPNIATTKGRIKVKSVGNIFFDINKSNFTVTKTVYPTNINDLVDEQVSIYPNPAKDILHITMSQFEGTVKILDMLGNVLLKTIANGDEFTIGTSGLADGVYYVQLSSTAGGQITKKVVIAR